MALRNWIDEKRLTSYMLNNPRIIEYYEKNPDKIDWRSISLFPEAIHLLESNPDKIDWF